MNKEEYQKALKSSKWKAKASKIRKRDGYKCVKCGSKESLHVHHTYYLEGKMPWEVPDECLITLCSVCHEKEHTDKDIKSFVRKTAPKKKTTNILKPIEEFKYIAVRSLHNKKLFNQFSNWQWALTKGKDTVVKGFDDKNEARKWLGELVGTKSNKNPKKKKNSSKTNDNKITPLNALEALFKLTSKKKKTRRK